MAREQPMTDHSSQLRGGRGVKFEFDADDDT